MKVLLDMNLSPRWVDHLASAQIHAVHWSMVGSVTASDAEIMSFAAEGDYTMITHDLDFSAILAATQGRKPSVVQLRSHDLSPEWLGKRLVRALHQCRAELERGAVLVVDTHRVRLRLLPLDASD